MKGGKTKPIIYFACRLVFLHQTMIINKIKNCFGWNDSSKAMTKKEALKQLNYLIDGIIIKGIKTAAQRKEFNRLCRLHSELVAEMPAVK